MNNKQHLCLQYPGFQSIIKQNIVIDFLMILIVFFIFASPVFADFSDNFESGNLSNWVIDGSDITEITTSTSAEGSRSFHLYDSTSSTHSDGIHATFSDFQPNYVGFYVRSGSTSASDAYFNLKDSSCGWIIYFYAKNDGTFTLYPSDATYVYNANQWYHIEFKNFDWTNRTFDYYIDGTLIHSSCSFRDSCSTANYAELYNFSGGVHTYWDDIRILSNYSEDTINQPPTIQSIDDQSAIGQHMITLNVSDPENDPLVLSGESSDTNIVPSNNILFSGSGANWTLTLIPTNDQGGTTTITVFVDDGNNDVVSTSFVFQSIPVLQLPENTQMLPGGSISIPLTLNNPENTPIYGLETTIGYDPLILQATGVSLTGTVLENDYINVYNIQNSGQVIICYAANTTVYNGEGIIGYLNFNIIGGEGESSSLTFVAAKQNETDVRTQHGDYFVQYNQQPSISTIATTYGNEDDTVSVYFSANDVESQPCALSITVASSNTTMVPQNNISFVCHHDSYTMTIIPMTNANGTTTIDITATDLMGLFDTTSFDLEIAAINDQPLIQNIPDQTISEDMSTNEIGFTISDVETIAGNLFVSAQSSNETLVPVNNIVLGGSGENRTLTITPAENQNGNATITITVSDGELSDSTIFDLTVTVVDDPPQVIAPIVDISANEDDSNRTIDLSTVFSDIDNDDASIVKTITNNSNASLVNASITNNSLTLDYQANQSGTAIISITAESNGKTVIDTFTVTVNPIDDSPEIATPLSDVVANEDDADTTFNLSDLFTDVDNDDATIVKSVQNSNTNLLSATISGNTLTLSYISDQSGTATISVTGTSNGLNVIDTFTVTVNPVDDFPEVSAPISDVVVNEDEPDMTIDLSSVFTDRDNDDTAIVKTVQNNNNSSLVSTTISNDILTLNFLADQYGTANITIMAQSGSLTVDDTFTITVNSIDDSPSVANEIADITVEEDNNNYTIDLSTVFTDIDNPDESIVKTILSNTNQSLVNTSISGNNLVLDFQQDQNGTATITVQGNSSGLVVSEEFLITVNAVDDMPVIAIPIADVAVNEDAAQTIIDLSTVFSDIDNDNASISKTITSNTNSTIVNAVIAGNALTLTFIENTSGSSIITIQGLSNGKTINDSFTVTVAPVDDPPHVVSEIQNLSLIEDANETIISLINVFADIDNDDSAIIKTVLSNSNSNLLNATIDNDTLTIVLNEEKSGTAIISIMANSNGLTVVDTFTVDVNSEDDPPEVVMPIQDIVVSEDDTNKTIDLSGIFTDVDNDDIAIVKAVQMNSNSTLVSAMINQNSLILSFLAEQSGTSDITIQATSNGKTVLDTFTVTVNAVDDPPEISTPIEDISVSEDANDTIISLTAVFTDKDNDDEGITKTIRGNTNSTLVQATIIDNELTLDYQTDQNGVAIISVMANSNGLTIIDQFTVVVDAIDDAPTVLEPVADISANEDDSNDTIDLADVFTDKDNDNLSINKTIYSNSNESLVTASISGNTLTLSYLPDQHGTAEIVILANSNGLEIMDQFVITVAGVDDSPVISQPITDISVNEDASDDTIDLTDVFNDIDNENTAIIKTILSNSNESLVAANISDNILTLSYLPDQNGSAEISILANSNGLTIIDQFTVTVNSIDDPPTVLVPLADIFANEDDSDDTIDLTDVFTDKDNDKTAIIKTILSNSNESLVAATINNNQLTLSYQPDQHGSSEIVVIANSNGLTITNTFIVNVVSIDDAPQLNNEIEDVIVYENASDTIIPLTDIFTDIDNDVIVKTIENNTNESLVLAIINENELILHYQPKMSGNSVITVRGTSNGLFEEDTFIVTVISTDSPPEVIHPIADIAVDINASLMIIPISNVFSDPENDIITISLHNNSNPNLITATLDGNNLTLSFAAQQEGEADITIRATANGETVDDIFTVFVSHTDVGPEVANPLNDIIVFEDSSPTTVDLSSVFTDPDNDDQTIVKTIVSNSNESLVMASVTDNQLMLSYTPDSNGESSVVIRGTSNGKTIDETVIIKVMPVDDPPVVQNPVDAITTIEDHENDQIDLTSLFSDPDNDDSIIQLILTQNTRPDLISANLTDKTLTLQYLPDQHGNGEITIRGISNGLFTEYTLLITIEPVDDSPVVANPLYDIAMNATAENAIIGLTDVFTDIDNDDNLIVKTVENNTNSSMIAATIDANNLFLFHTIGIEGEADITIMAISNGLTVNDVFTVLIDSSDMPPILANPMEDITLTENAPATIIPLTSVFTDPDDDDLAIEKRVFSNSNDQLISAAINNNNQLIISCKPDINGSSTIIIRGLSKGLYVDDSIFIVVLPVDNPPEVINPLEDIFIDEDAADMTVSLTPVFADVDNDNNAINFSVLDNTNTQLVNATIDAHNLVLHFIPDQNGSSIITIQAESNGLTVMDQMVININPIDDPPETGTLISDVTVDEDSEDTIIDLSTAFVDIDNSLIIKTIQDNSNSALVHASIVNDTLKLDYIENQNGSAKITIAAMSNGKSVSQSFKVSVTPVNDAPTALNSNVSVLEDMQVIGRILATDIENDPITIHLLTQPEYGWLTILDFSTGDFIYQPYANYDATDAFTFNVADHQLNSQTAQVSISITPVNDLPGMSELQDYEIYEGTTLTQLFTISDLDAQQLTITVTTTDPLLLPYNQMTIVGGQIINSRQAIVPMVTPEMSITLRIKPASYKSGQALVTVKVVDEEGGSVEKSFTVIVKKHTIVATSIGNGQIQPSGTVEVNTGTPYVFFTIQPDPGSLIDYIIVDGAIMSARTMYTFWNIYDDHTITAVFRAPTLYTISTQAGIGGTISPSGSVQVQDGQSQTFTIQANTGYIIDYLNVDGVYVAATTQYSFNNVISNHTIEAYFESIPAPIAAFNASPVSGSPPLEVSFIDQSQNTITTRIWNFGDGTTSMLQNPKHTYFSPGKYTVSLTVNGPGGQDKLTKESLIVTSILQADFTAFPASGAFPLPVTFTAQASTSVTGVIWNFGDGDTSTQLNPSHTYTTPGLYNVQLTVYGLGTILNVVKKEYIKVKGRNISGRVTASDTGSGLSGYSVEVIQRQSKIKVGETYTDANGYYSFVCEPTALTCLTTFHQIPAASDLILAVWPPPMKNDYYMQYYSGQSLEEKATLISTINNDQAGINLVLEKVSPLGIRGKISDNGMPETGIQVNAFSEKLNYGLSTYADSNGVYTLAGLKPSNDYRIYVWGMEENSDIYYSLPENKIPGQDLPTYSVYKWDAATLVEPKDPHTQHIDIMIDHAINKRGSIKGYVSTSENKPAEKIWVYAFSDAMNTGNGAVTDQNGAYTITALPEISDTDPYSMGYIVAVHSVLNNQQDDTTPKLWYTYQAYPGVSDKSQAELVKTGAINIDFHLKTQCTLSGKVTDIYESPIPGAEINVRSDITGVVLSGITDQNGQYAITGLAPVKDYLITASAVYYPLMYYNGKSSQDLANRVDLSDGDVDGIDFSLDTGMMINGTVFIDSSDNPSPSGLWVNIWSESTRTGGDVPTDMNGDYQIAGLNPSATDYIISIRKQDYMPAFYCDNSDSDLMNDTVYSSDDAKGIAASTMQWAVDRNLILRTGLSISGVVQYMGVPTSGIRVEAWSEGSGGWGMDVSTDSLTNGHNYMITGLPPGEYNVTISPLHYQDDSYRVELTNADLINLFFPLQNLENMICGTIYGLGINKKAQITAWSEGTGFNKTLLLTGTGTDLDYTITQVKPASDYRVRFTGVEYPMQVYNNHFTDDEADLIAVSQGTVSGIDFHVLSGTLTISGTITFPGSAIPGDIAWVDAFSSSTGSDGSVQVMLLEGHTANYQIKGLKEAPDFTVVAWGKQYKEQYYDQQIEKTDATPVNTADDIPDDHINFNLSPGTSISGSVFEENIPVVGIQVIAISDKTNSFGGTTTASDGSYVIEGLDLANDFIVKVQKSGMAPFYYHETSTTRDEKLATRISTIANNHVSGIDIHMAVLESISGTVRDEDGKSLSGIWVNVWSDIQQTGEGMYTAEDGTYLIDALPKSDDYKVSIGEHAALTYVPEEKTGVKSGSSGIDFVLRKAYQLKGLVTNISGQTIVKAEVELYSETEDFYVWTKTDGSGTYNIQCVPSASDYVLNVLPPEDLSYVSFYEPGLQIDSSTTVENSMQKDIILKTGSFIKGYVYKDDTTTPIKDANINVYSKDQNYGSVGKTNENGYYIINNIPIASDYEISVKTDSFAKTIKTDQVAGSTINFILELGGTLSGKVIEQDGAPLENVLVKVISPSAHISGIQRTDSDGTFAISGMPRYLETGYEITDYLITIFPENYAEQSQGQKRVGEFVSFICKKAQITGTITDSLGNPKPEGVILGIKLYHNITEGGFVTKTESKSDGSFTIEGLGFDTDYQIKIHIMKSKISPNVQWVNQEETGISGRDEAGVFVTGNHLNVKLSGTWNK